MDLPVICDSEACRHVWFAGGILGGGGVATCIGNTVSPCPKCGGDGKIPDGRYGPRSMEFFKTEDGRKVIAKLLHLEPIAKGAIDKAGTQDEDKAIDRIASEIKGDSSLFTIFKKLVPKSIADVRNLLAIIMILISSCDMDTVQLPDSVELPDDSESK